MNYNQKIFLEQFDQPIRKYIIDFCNKISEKQYDVFILLARKAACFLSVLEDVGLISLNGIVVSERILEYDTEWLKEKNVAIIDDTIISGSSIYKIIEKLKAIGVQDISVHAFCINQYWFVDEMLENDRTNYLKQPFLKVDHTSSLRFCKQIVNALSVVPRPYNIDFPTYERIRFTKANYSTILEDTNWKIVNTTTQLQTQNNITCISLNPKRKTLSDFNDTLGGDFSNILFVKIRIYSTEIYEKEEKGQPKYLSKVVPYVIFNPIDIDFANTIINAICECENVSIELLSKQLISQTSKLLFIQYYFAERLFRWWNDYTEKLLGKKLKYTLNERSLFLLFSPNIIEIIKDFSFNKKINLKPTEHYDSFLYENLCYSDNEQPINPLQIKEELLNSFLDLYYTKELVARRIVKDMKKDAFTDAQYDDIVNRLDDGISMFKLKQKISTFVNNSTDTNLILSTFLDNAIDTGIIVPITIHRGNHLYRGFRHGEEIVWGDTNDKLLAIFYERFMDGNKSLPKFWFEKLLVLFLKLGLKEGILEEYNLITPQNQKVSLVGIRSYLYGQVSVTYSVEPNQQIDYNPILDYESKGYWTSERFKDLCVLQENEDKHYNFHFDILFYQKYEKNKGENEVDDLDPTLKNKTLNIADLLRICKENNLINDSNSGLVKLTSCTNLHDNTSSISAELHIFKQNLDSYVNTVRGNINRLSVEILNNLRSSTANHLWTAINSGREKFLDFKHNEGVNLINEIKNSLSNVNSFASRLWEEYWRKDIELLQNNDTELDYLNNRMGIILVDINSAIIYIHLLIFKSIQSNIEQFKSESDDLIRSLDEKIAEKKTQIDCFKQASQDQFDFDNAPTINMISDEISNLKKEKSNVQRKIEYWGNYWTKNVERIRSNYKELSQFDKNKLKSQHLILEILSDELNSDVHSKINNAIQVLYELRKDVDDVLKEFSLIVPQWGKINKKVKYSSLIHLNCLSNNLTEREALATIVKKAIGDFEYEEFQEQKNDKSIVLLRIEGVKSGGKGYIIGGKGQTNFERLLKLCSKILQICTENKFKVIISLIKQKKDIMAYFNPQTNNYDNVKENLYDTLPVNSDENQINMFNIEDSQVLYLNQNRILYRMLGEKEYELNTIQKDKFYTLKIKNMDNKSQTTISVNGDYVAGDQYKTQTGNNSPITIGDNNVIQSYNTNEQKLVSELKTKGVTESQADELIKILREERQDPVSKTLGTRVKEWCNNVKTIGLNVLANLIFTVMYGVPA